MPVSASHLAVHAILSSPVWTYCSYNSSKMEFTTKVLRWLISIITRHTPPQNIIINTCHSWGHESCRGLKTPPTANQERKPCHHNTRKHGCAEETFNVPLKIVARWTAYATSKDITENGLIFQISEGSEWSMERPNLNGSYRTLFLRFVYDNPALLRKSIWHWNHRVNWDTLPDSDDKSRCHATLLRQNWFRWRDVLWQD